jgi:hypothetical protein
MTIALSGRICIHLARSKYYFPITACLVSTGQSQIRKSAVTQLSLFAIFGQQVHFRLSCQNYPLPLPGYKGESVVLDRKKNLLPSYDIFSRGSFGGIFSSEVSEALRRLGPSIKITCFPSSSLGIFPPHLPNFKLGTLQLGLTSPAIYHPMRNPHQCR